MTCLLISGKFYLPSLSFGVRDAHKTYLYNAKDQQIEAQLLKDEVEENSFLKLGGYKRGVLPKDTGQTTIHTYQCFFKAYLTFVLVILTKLLFELFTGKRIIFLKLFAGMVGKPDLLSKKEKKNYFKDALKLDLIQYKMFPQNNNKIGH